VSGFQRPLLTAALQTRSASSAVRKRLLPVEVVEAEPDVIDARDLHPVIDVRDELVEGRAAPSHDEVRDDVDSDELAKATLARATLGANAPHATGPGRR
jgi:hypothetical protein